MRSRILVIGFVFVFAGGCGESPSSQAIPEVVPAQAPRVPLIETPVSVPSVSLSEGLQATAQVQEPLDGVWDVALLQETALKQLLVGSHLNLVLQFASESLVVQVRSAADSPACQMDFQFKAVPSRTECGCEILTLTYLKDLSLTCEEESTTEVKDLVIREFSKVFGAPFLPEVGEGQFNLGVYREKADLLRLKRRH